MPNHLNKRTNLPKKAATKLLQKAIWKSRIVISVRYQLLSSSRMNRHKQKTSSHIFAFNRNLCWFFGCFFFLSYLYVTLEIMQEFFFPLGLRKNILPYFAFVSCLWCKQSQPASKQTKENRAKKWSHKNGSV